MPDSVTIRPLRPDDRPRVAEIYRQGIETGVATFETEVPDWEAWDGSHLSFCRLVAEGEPDLPTPDRKNRPRRVVGWAALSPVSDRCAYGGVAEVSVYVAEEARERLGKLDGRWRDVLLLERRSPTVGTE